MLLVRPPSLPDLKLNAIDIVPSLGLSHGTNMMVIMLEVARVQHTVPDITLKSDARDHVHIKQDFDNVMDIMKD